jgi:hypothetical protein
VAQHEVLEFLVRRAKFSESADVLPIVRQETANRVTVALRYRPIVAMSKANERTMECVPIFYPVGFIKCVLLLRRGARLLIAAALCASASEKTKQTTK